MEPCRETSTMFCQHVYRKLNPITVWTREATKYGLEISDSKFDTHGSVHRRLLSRNTNKIQLCNRIYYSKVFLKAQHVSSGTPLIIRSSKLYLQPLVYIPIW